VQCAGRVPAERRPGASRPARQVLDRPGQDAGVRVPGNLGVQGGQALVEVGPALEGCEERQPRHRHRCQAALADAVPQRDGFLRGAAQSSPLAGDVQPEREALEGVQDGHAVAVLAGRRQHEGVAESVRVVVAQVEGRVPEVPEQVQVRHRLVGVGTAVHGQVDRGGELLAGRGPVACDLVQRAGQQQLEAPGAGGVVRGDL
jgi:hypothetical protein